MNYHATVPSPIGDLLVVADEDAVKRVYFPTEKARPDPSWRSGSPLLETVARQFREYFAGKRKQFDLPLAPEGTDFQRAVWKELTRIEFGETISYSELARRIRRPKAVRAVGAANGANPIPVVIPCHRVIGKNGTLTGFGGGLPIKKQLLELEECQLPFPG